MTQFRPATIEMLERERRAESLFAMSDAPRALAVYESGVREPICTSVSYTFDVMQEAADVFAGAKDAYIYPRLSLGTPPVERLRRRILDLELGEDHPQQNKYEVILTSSGMSAIALVAQTLCAGHGSFLSSPHLYGGTRELFEKRLRQLGIHCYMSPTTHVDFAWPYRIALANAVSDHVFRQIPATKPAFLFAEDNANPLPTKLDHAQFASFAHAHTMLYVCDNTITTPILDKPLLKGADIVIESLTKNINGRSNAMGGAIIARKDLTLDVATNMAPRNVMQEMKNEWFPIWGPVLDARAADVIYHNSLDLEERMKRKVIAAGYADMFLRSHSKVRAVYGPGGDLISFDVDTDDAGMVRFMSQRRLMKYAPHLGDVQTVCVIPAQTTHSHMRPQDRRDLGISDTLIRVSVGTEDPADIVDDLKRCLDAV